MSEYKRRSDVSLSTELATSTRANIGAQTMLGVLVRMKERFDSPHFVRAYKELGIAPETLEIKHLEDFRDPKVPQEIQEMRFEHHVRRLYKTVRQIMSRRKELIKGSKGSDSFQQSFLGTSLYAVTPQHDKSFSVSQSGKIPKEFIECYTKTKDYFKSSHKEADVSCPDLNLTSSDYNISEFSTLSNVKSLYLDQIRKYNEQRRRAISEVDSFYDLERKRNEVAAEIQRREEKVMQNEAMKAMQHIEVVKAHREKEIEKAQRLKDISIGRERSRRELERQVRESQLKADELFQQRRGELLQQIAELSEKENQKKLSLDARRDEFHRRDEEIIDSHFISCVEKIEDRSKRHDLLLDSRRRQGKMRNEMVMSKLEEVKEMKEAKEQEHFERMREKILKRAQSLQEWLARKKKEEDERLKEKRSKEQKLLEGKREAEEANESKLKSLEEKFKRAEEMLERRKDEWNRSVMVHQEARRLKMQDMTLNVDQEKRRTNLKLDMSMGRKLRIQEKLTLKKIQNEFLEKTRVEAALHAKLERERILGSISLQKLRPVVPNSSDSLDNESLEETKGRSLKKLRQMISSSVDRGRNGFLPGLKAKPAKENTSSFVTYFPLTRPLDKREDLQRK